MGTSYKLGCKRCKKMIDTFTRQAWGVWINPESVAEMLKFLTKHTLECGEGLVTTYSEHCDEFFEWEYEGAEALKGYFDFYDNIPKWVEADPTKDEEI